VSDTRGWLQAIGEWRRSTSLLYQALFALALLVLLASFLAGLAESFRRFGLPPIGADATILGRALFARGDYGAALEEFRLAGVVDPESYARAPEVAFVRPVVGADALVRRHRQSLRERPGDAAVHLALGEALLGSGRVDESLSSLERARDLDPRLAEVHGTLARAYLSAGRLEEAERAFRQGLEVDATDPDLHEGLGFALYRLERRDEAMAHFARARSLRGETSR
jgi:Flp pilus assembly protein TadD